MLFGIRIWHLKPFALIIIISHYLRKISNSKTFHTKCSFMSLAFSKKTPANRIWQKKSAFSYTIMWNPQLQAKFLFAIRQIRLPFSKKNSPNNFFVFFPAKKPRTILGESGQFNQHFTRDFEPISLHQKCTNLKCNYKTASY